MKKLSVLFFAAVMMFSIAFVGDALSSNGSMSANAQTVTIKRHRRHGVVRRVYRGGKHVGYRIYRGGRWVTVKTYHGGKVVVRKTKNASKKIFHKIHRSVQ
ncbi:MAG: hypothetical protein ABJA02_00990 [Acidobacteriota bacterium]